MRPIHYRLLAEVIVGFLLLFYILPTMNAAKSDLLFFGSIGIGLGYALYMFNRYAKLLAD